MKKINLLGLLALAMVIGFISCKKKTDKTVTPVTEIPNVRLKAVIDKEVEQICELTATVQPEAKNNIAPSSPGRIRHILVEVGQHVAKGQKLVQMDVANLSNFETQLENLKRSYKRVQELFKVGGASQQDLDNVKVQLEQAETNLKTLNENTFLLSPISGIVTARNYDDGDMYSGQMPVLTVMTINPVKVMVNVSESFYAQVKMGMPVDLKFDVLGGQSFTGRVSLIYPTIDERTRTFGMEVKLNNNNNKVRPGMFGRVKLEFGKVKHAVVPDQAVIKQVGSGTRYVYVYNNGRVEYKPVELGRRLDTDFEVLSGLTSGEQVVVAGQSKLVDGSKVKVIN